MKVDEFRGSITIYRQLLESGGKDPYRILNLVDERLADISNHIAVCHRVIGVKQAVAASSWFTVFVDPRPLERDSDVLDQVIAVQGEMFEFRAEVLQAIRFHVDPR